MSPHLLKLGDLNCRVVGPFSADRPPQAAVIFCHGFGAGGDDLVPLAGELMQLNSDLADNYVFIFPEAPLSLPEMPGARAWWPIDLITLQQAAEQGRLRDLRQEAPPLLPEAREKLMGVISAVQEHTGLRLSRFVLGGFSQGSMLATDVALRLPEVVGGLIVFSGTLLVEPEWRELAMKRPELRVLQSHGTVDPLLPYEAALWLRDLFQESGADIEFLSFAGMHTIPYEAVTASAEFLTKLRD
jgi:phospholipase/carboxylesterase